MKWRSDPKVRRSIATIKAKIPRPRRRWIPKRIVKQRPIRSTVSPARETNDGGGIASLRRLAGQLVMTGRWNRPTGGTDRWNRPVGPGAKSLNRTICNGLLASREPPPTNLKVA